MVRGQQAFKEVRLLMIPARILTWTLIPPHLALVLSIVLLSVVNTGLVLFMRWMNESEQESDSSGAGEA